LRKRSHPRKDSRWLLQSHVPFNILMHLISYSFVKCGNLGTKDHVVLMDQRKAILNGE
jgi:hypothetical protein